MQYPDEFAARVRELFPKQKMVELWLKQGNPLIGKMLDEHQKHFTPDEIIQAFEQGHTDHLLVEARRSQQMHDLYIAWYKLEQAQRRVASSTPQQIHE